MGFCPGDCCGSWIYVVRYKKLFDMLPLFDFVLLPLVMLAYSVRQSSSYVKWITRQKHLQDVFIQHRNEGHDDDNQNEACMRSSFP